MSRIKHKIDIKLLFVVIVFFCMVEAIVYSFFINGNGNYFYIGTMNSDPGGDFYLSLLFSSKLKPYDNIFPYPPLTVLFCYLLRFITHDERTLNANVVDFDNTFYNIYANNFDYKNMFFILSIITFIIMFYLIYINLRKKEKNEIMLFLISILLLCNSGLLCALVRGNLLLQCLLFLLIFSVTYYRNEKKYIYISILSLVLAFNIKPYAAVFGVLYLYNKRYKEAIISSILAIISFAIPFCFLNGGFEYNFIAFFKNLKNFGNSSYMFGISSFICTITNRFPIFSDYEQPIKIITQLFSIFFCVILFLSGFMQNTKWKKILIVTLILILLPSNFGYILSFMMIPTMFFIRDEYVLKKNNIFILFSFLFLTAPFVITRYHLPTVRYIICNLLLVVLSLWLIYDGFILSFFKCRGNNNE